MAVPQNAVPFLSGHNASLHSQSSLLRQSLSVTTLQSGSSERSSQPGLHLWPSVLVSARPSLSRLAGIPHPVSDPSQYLIKFLILHHWYLRPLVCFCKNPVQLVQPAPPLPQGFFLAIIHPFTPSRLLGYTSLLVLVVYRMQPRPLCLYCKGS